MTEPVSFDSLDPTKRAWALEWYYRLATVTLDDRRALGFKMTAIAFFQQLGMAICGLEPMPVWSLSEHDHRRDTVAQVERFGEKVTF